MSRNRADPGKGILKAQKRRFILPAIFDQLRRACESRRYKEFFQEFLNRYRKQLYAIAVLFIIMLLDSTLLNFFRIVFGVKPDTILATLVFFVFFFNLGWVVSFAFLGGLFRDLFSLFSVGFNTAICIIWVILVHQISRRLSVETHLMRGIMLCLIILLNNLVVYSILFVQEKPIFMGIVLKTALIESVLTLFLALPAYRFFAYLFAEKSG